MSIAGIGHFTGTQGLLRLLYGIFRGETAKLFCAGFDTKTMECVAAPPWNYRTDRFCFCSEACFGRNR